MLLFILRFHQLIAWDFVPALQAAMELLEKNELVIQTKAQQIARDIQGRLPVIYTTAPYEGVAMRFKQQLNENSKQLCWYNVVPALNHNEIVAWQGPDERLVVLMWCGYIGHNRIALQQAITQTIIQKHTAHFIWVEAPQQSYFIDSIYLIHLGDWISFYLAQFKGINPLSVDNIDQVKSGLSKYN